MKSIAFLFFLLFAFPCWSLSLDWSGWTRMEAYYQNSDSHSYYGNYHFVLEPEIQVIDGLTVTGRLELFPFSPQKRDQKEASNLLTGSASQALDVISHPRGSLKKNFSFSENYSQRGFVFIYGEDSKQTRIENPFLLLRASQLYLDYQAEFLKLRMGRAPYHFGLGASYSATQDPFRQWITVYNQAVLHLDYSPFYFQPMIFHKEKGSLLGSAQAGLRNEQWKLEALFQYDFSSDSFLELFGQYEQENWGLKSSFAYALEEERNMTLALEGFMQVATKIPFQVEVKAGGALGHLSFHPHYNVALLYWNRFMEELPLQVSDSAEGKKVLLENKVPEHQDSGFSSFQIAQGQIQNGLYFSPRLLFSFLDDSLKIRPIGLLARDLKEKTMNYELDMEAVYQWEESLFFTLTGGALYTKELHFALLAQAAVSF